MDTREYKLKDLIIKYDNKRKPLSTLVRNKMKKNYPYYGANGVIDYVEDYLFDGEYILVAEDGTVLIDNLYPVIYKVQGKFWVSNHAHVFKANEKIVLQDFLYYSLKKKAINDKITGSTQLKLNQENMDNIELQIPDLETQKRIVSILSKIDRKIEINNELNNNLLEMQKTYFKELFKNENYQVLKMNDVCEISAGGDAPKEKSDIADEEYPYPIISNGIVNEGIYGYSKEYKIDKKSITISARGTIGFKVLRNYNYYPIVRLISLTPKIDEISAEYLFYALDEVQILGTGTTQQQLTVPMVKDIKIKIYDKELIKKFTDFSITLNNRINASKEENSNLNYIRDILLPKLLNNDIELDEIDI